MGKRYNVRRQKWLLGVKIMIKKIRSSPDELVESFEFAVECATFEIADTTADAVVTVAVAEMEAAAFAAWCSRLRIFFLLFSNVVSNR